MTKSSPPREAGVRDDRSRAAASSPIRSLAHATDYLDGLINRERDPRYAYERLDLRPIEALLEGIGHPERALCVIHVAGSKGKGSTCLFAEAILAELGERVGTFTSPHLESWTERFRIDGAPVGAERLVAAVERLRPVVERLRAGPAETRPSFFDVTTAVAFLLFAEAGMERALIEVGLGGRLDSTNVVAPTVTCITSIELEHTDKLGHSEAAIAGEKAGIVKPGVPLVLGALRPEADAVVRTRAREAGAELVVLGEDFSVDVAGPDEPARTTFRGPGALRFETSMATPGAAAARNAALALACVERLAVHPVERLASAASVALAKCRLPARIERLAADPRVIVDAAHTAESARELARALPGLAPHGYELLISVSSDKNLEPILAALLPGASRVWTTRADPNRSLPAALLAERVRETFASVRPPRAGELEVISIENPEQATRQARAGLSGEHVLCVCGSVYLAGRVRHVLRADDRSA